jgi:peptidylprolyl isomerase
MWYSGSMDIRVQPGDTVTVHYQLSYQNGTLLDHSLAKGPVAFVVGNGFVIKGLEDAVLGMALGEQKKLTLSPHQAYGPKEKDLLLTIPRTSVPKHIDIEEGKRIEITTEDGTKTKVRLCEITPSTVTLDGNLDPAGQTILLSVEVITIA